MSPATLEAIRGLSTSTEILRAAKRNEKISPTQLHEIAEELKQNNDPRLSVVRKMEQGLSPLLNSLEQRTREVPDRVEINITTNEIRENIGGLGFHLKESLPLKVSPALIGAKNEYLRLQSKTVRLLAQIFLQETIQEKAAMAFNAPVKTLIDEAAKVVQDVEARLASAPKPKVLPKTKKVVPDQDLIFLDEAPQQKAA